MKQKKVWLLAGIPGSGKSTWAREQIAKYGGVHCSRDEIRFSLLKEDEEYFSHENEVINIWHNKIIEAILNPEVRDVYIDATHLTEKARKKVLDILPKGEYEVITTFFNTPLDICLERNEQRTGRAYVPPQTIRNMYAGYNNHTILTPMMHIRWEEEE